MYEYEIIKYSLDKGKLIKKGKASINQFKEFLPLEIFEQLKDDDKIEFEFESGEEFYKIKKI